MQSSSAGFALKESIFLLPSITRKILRNCIGHLAISSAVLRKSFSSSLKVSHRNNKAIVSAIWPSLATLIHSLRL